MAFAVADLDDEIYGVGGRFRSSKPTLAASNDTPLICSPARLPDPTTIPPRKWLLGTILLRGFVSVLVAPGGTGKSIFAMTAGLSMATGTKLLGLHVWERVNVWVINEDPLEELERRLAAIMMRHKVSDEHVAGYYFMNSMDERVVNMATRGPDGFTVVHPDEKAIIEQIQLNNIGVLIVDPYAESHSLEENSNPDMIKAAGAWRRVARATDCAIFLVHHVRKGKDDVGIDAARGAKGLTDSARVGLTMASMTEQEAEKLGIPKRDRHQYVRVDDAKVNLSPRIDDARWFRLEQMSLGNATETYRHGDHVAALVRWEPPKLFDQITHEQIDEILKLIDAGPAPGQLYAGTTRGKPQFWAGNLIIRAIDCPEKQAQMMIDKWVENGLLFLEKFKNPTTRKDAVGVRVDWSKKVAQ